LSVERGNAIFEFLTPLNGLYGAVDAEKWNVADSMTINLKESFKRLLDYYPNLIGKRETIEEIIKRVSDRDKGCLTLILTLWKYLIEKLELKL